MKRSFGLLNSKVVNIAIGIFMAALWGWFAYRHVVAFQNTNEWAYLLFCASETLTAAFFMFRTQPETVSVDPLDWLFAVAGTFTALLFSPAAWGILPVAKSMLVMGITLQILGLVSLNRSFALVAAKRQIKTAGMYRFVRHPLYAGYLLLFTGYILTNTTLMNVVLFVMTMGFLYVRMVREEKHLALDPAYGQYMRQVRYRVIPFMF
ncbi:MAG: isoprenylcysteine carboxylmethyltransferase family protein [Burkholderiales bacterium]|nr:isoprenylcysteine carboxylmethyltransferase family protein [Burkholderiales bacterium]